MTDPTNAPAPEGQEPTPAPEAPSTPDYGLSPEELQNAANLYRGLNNLDTRGQYIQQVVRPDIDGQFLRGMFEPQQQEQQDPWQQFTGEPEYEEPEYQPAFDPDMLRQAVRAEIEQGQQQMWGQLQEMAVNQQITESAAQATQAANLPSFLSGSIEQQVRQQHQLQPNRQFGDIANEVAQKYARELAQYQAAPPATPAPQGQVPGGPAPSQQERPTDWKSMIEYAQQNLQG